MERIDGEKTVIPQSVLPNQLTPQNTPPGNVDKAHPILDAEFDDALKTTREEAIERHIGSKDTTKQSRRRVTDVILVLRKAKLYIDRVAMGKVMKVGESKADYEKRTAKTPSPVIADKLADTLSETPSRVSSEQLTEDEEEVWRR